MSYTAKLKLRGREFTVIDGGLLLFPDQLAGITDHELIECVREWGSIGREFDEKLWREEYEPYEYARSGFVYFLRRFDGAVKVGFSRQLDERVATLKNKHGNLELVGQIETNEPESLEKELHELLLHWRIDKRREWFVLNQQDVDGLVEAYTCPSE